MRKVYMSSSYALDVEKLKGKTEEQANKEALGEVLRRMGLSFQLQAARGETEIPQMIRVEVIKELWDIHVRLHTEGAKRDV